MSTTTDTRTDYLAEIDRVLEVLRRRRIDEQDAAYESRTDYRYPTPSGALQPANRESRRLDDAADETGDLEDRLLSQRGRIAAGGGRITEALRRALGSDGAGL